MNQIRTRDDGDGDETRRPWLDERVDTAVIDLALTSAHLPGDRIAHHREMLMNHIAQSAPSSAVDDSDAASSVPPAAARRRRRLMLAGASAVAIGALVAGPAAATHLLAFTHKAPHSVQDADTMDVIYQGQSYSWAQIWAMQAKGKAMISVEEPATYAKGQVHVFDTSDQAKEWACANIASMSSRPACVGITTQPTALP